MYKRQTFSRFGSSGLVTTASNSPSLFIRDSKTFRNGQIFINEPIKKPERSDKISFLKFLNKYDKTLLKIISPTIHPEAKMKSICKSKFFIALIINSYFESKRRINDPLMPGSIVAVIAIDPDKNINNEVLGVDAGERNEINPAIKAPITKKKIFLLFMFSTCLMIITPEDKTKPKNRPQILYS